MRTCPRCSTPYRTTDEIDVRGTRWARCMRCLDVTEIESEQPTLRPRRPSRVGPPSGPESTLMALPPGRLLDECRAGGPASEADTRVVTSESTREVLSPSSSQQITAPLPGTPIGRRGWKRFSLPPVTAPKRRPSQPAIDEIVGGTNATMSSGLAPNVSVVEPPVSLLTGDLELVASAEALRSLQMDTTAPIAPGHARVPTPPAPQGFAPIPVAAPNGFAQAPLPHGRVGHVAPQSTAHPKVAIRVVAGALAAATIAFLVGFGCSARSDDAPSQTSISSASSR